MADAAGGVGKLGIRIDARSIACPLIIKPLVFFPLPSVVGMVPRSIFEFSIVTASMAGLIKSTLPWKVVELMPRAVIEVTPGFSDNVAETLMSSPAVATLKVFGGIPKTVIELPCGV